MAVYGVILIVNLIYRVETLQVPLLLFAFCDSVQLWRWDMTADSDGSDERDDAWDGPLNR